MWWTTVTGWNSGTRSPGSSSAAARAPVASSTARQRISPCSAVVTDVVETEVTRTPVRTVPGGSVRAEQLRQRLGAALGHAEPAAGEGAQREVRAPAGRRQVRVAQQRGEQRAQEAVDRTGGQPAGRQGLAGGQLRAGQQPFGGRAREPGQGGAEPGLVDGGAERGAGPAPGRRPPAGHGHRPPRRPRRGGAGALARARTACSAPRALPAPGRSARAVVAPVAVQQDTGCEGAQHEPVEPGCLP